MYTQLGVMTKGTVIEVNVSELGMVTAGGKVVFGKYAQITNNPENDGCINAVLRTSFRFLHPSNSSSYFLFHSRMICSLFDSSHDLVLLDFLFFTRQKRAYPGFSHLEHLSAAV